MEYCSDYNYCVDFSQDSFSLYNSFTNSLTCFQERINQQFEKKN
jgi:hypothetical protein